MSSRSAAARRSRWTRFFLETLEQRELLTGTPTGALLFQFLPGQDAAANALLAQHDGYQANATSIPGLVRVQGNSAVLDQLAATYRANPAVSYVEPEYEVSIALAPNDPAYTGNQLWGMNGTHGVRGPQAWDYDTGATTTVVADIDTGVDYRHEDLYLNIWLNQGEIPSSWLAGTGLSRTVQRSELVDTDADGLFTFWDLNASANAGLVNDINTNGRIDAGDLLRSIATGGWMDGADGADPLTRIDDLVGWDFANNDNDPFDGHSHGTHTVGTIAGIGNNGVGVVGVAWKAQVMAIKFLTDSGGGTDANGAASIRYAADMGARLSNNSWGGGGFSSTLFNAIAYADTRNHVVVAAAGNSNNNNDANPFYPASYNTFNGVTLNNLLSVASIDSAGNKSSFSNYGATSVDLGAPGSSIYSTVPNNGYAFFSGTSMATPHVAGVLTMLAAEEPSLTHTQLMQRLLSNTRPLASMNGITVTGGVADAQRAVYVNPFVVVSSAPTGEVPASVDRVTLNFSRPVLQSSFTTADVASLTGPGGPITPSGVTRVTATQYEVTFPSQSTAGTYTIVIGSGILDDGGRSLDQDRDGVRGEAAQDQFTSFFDIVSTDAPEIEVTSTAAVANGGTVAYGTALLTGAVQRTYTVRNVGTGTLLLGPAITVPAGFSVVSGFGSTSLAANATTTFVVQLTAAAVGSYSGVVTFNTNDTTDNPFSFTVTGSVVPSQTIDDGTAGFAATGAWDTYVGSVGHQNDFYYTLAGTGSRAVTWTFNVVPGQYRVATTWLANASNRVTNAPYTLLDGSTALTTVLVNQRQVPADFTEAGSSWKNLATVQVVGNTLVVRLTNDAGPADNYVIADAVRIERVGNVVQGPQVQVTVGGSGLANGGSVAYGATVTGSAVSRTYTVQNIGTADLILGSTITVPNGFTVTTGFGSTTLAPNASTTFTVRLDATATGSFAGNVSFTTNDADDNPFAFAVSGSVSAPSVVTILDNSSQGFTTAGAWDSYTGLGHLNNLAYTTNGSGSATATWTFNVNPGQYRVATTWLERPNRANNAPYTMLDGTTSLGTVRVNQQLAPNDFTDAGTAWENLSTVVVTGTTLTVRLANDANPTYLIADAVRIERIGGVPQGPQVVVRDGTTAVGNGGSVAYGATLVGSGVSRTFTVQNTGTADLVLGSTITVPSGFSVASGFGSTTLAPNASTTFTVRLTAAAAGSYSGNVSFTTNDGANNPFVFAVSGTVQTSVVVDNGGPGFSTTGTWDSYTGLGHQGNLAYTTSGNGSAVATWTFVLGPGTYRVATTWLERPNRASNAPYTLLDGDTALTTVRVDQRAAANDFTDAGTAWENLATVTITGNTLVVRLSNDALPEYLIADAVRVERV